MNSKLLLPLVFSAALSACGGGDAPTPPPPPPVQGAATSATPTHLAYADPSGSGWRLVKDASSTDKRLVLNLVGPVGLQTRGVGFNVRRGAGLAFSTFDNGGYAHDTGVYQLKGTNSNFESYAGTAADPVLFVSAPLKSGDVLSTGIFQKEPQQCAQGLERAAGAGRRDAGRFHEDRSVDPDGDRRRVRPARDQGAHPSG